VGSGVTLTLRDITFAGKTGNSAPLVVVEDGGKLVPETGAVIRDNVNAGDGGVYIAGGGSFEMTGSATISGNEADGGGIYVHESGTITIKGSAEVSDNTANNNNNGDGISTGGNNTIMVSGSAEISGNNANIAGGVEVRASEFVMAGGTISGNTAAEVVGVYAGQGHLKTSPSKDVI
jgi:hypothetical protein